MKKLLLLSCVLALSGCASHQKQVAAPVVVAPVVVEYVPMHHNDWKNVKGTTWSLQLPNSFEEQQLSEEQVITIKFAQLSKDLNALVMFAVDPSNKSVDAYTQEFNAGIAAAGGKIVDVRQSNPGHGMSGLTTTMSLYTIEDKLFVVHFITTTGSKVYSLDCSTEEHPKEIGPLCMQIMKTVKIES